MEKAYKKLAYFFLILFILMVFGFYEPYFALFPHFDKNFTAVVHIHAAALIIWVVLLVVQPILVLRKKLPLHRLLGKFTYFLVMVIVVTSIAVMHKQYREGIEQKMTSTESLKTLLIPFSEILFFSIFYLLSVIHRHHVKLHMRYIICTALVLITPSLARVMGYWFNAGQFTSYRVSFLLIDIMLMALILFDRQNKLNYQPYFMALILFIIFDVSWYLLGHPF